MYGQPQSLFFITQPQTERVGAGSIKATTTTTTWYSERRLVLHIYEKVYKLIRTCGLNLQGYGWKCSSFCFLGYLDTSLRVSTEEKSTEVYYKKCRLSPILL